MLPQQFVLAPAKKVGCGLVNHPDYAIVRADEDGIGCLFKESSVQRVPASILCSQAVEQLSILFNKFGNQTFALIADQSCGQLCPAECAEVDPVAARVGTCWSATHFLCDGHFGVRVGRWC